MMPIDASQGVRMEKVDISAAVRSRQNNHVSNPRGQFRSRMRDALRASCKIADRATRGASVSA